MAKYDVGSLGPAEGSAVPIDISLRDSFRSMFLWFVLLAWSDGISLLLGIAPTIAFAMAGAILSRSVYLLSTLEALRMVITLSHAVLGPYLVLFWFLLLALWVPLYRERLSRAFGYTPVLRP